MSDKPLAKMTLSELIEAMRNRGPDDIRYRPFQAELERRMAISQIRSSQYQLAAVIAMFITAAIAAYSIG
jgi:hypothetical protein